MLTTTDNNCGKIKVPEEYLADFQLIANKKIVDLVNVENPNLLVFPNNINETKDKIKDERIFSLQKSTLTTGNIMGFVGVNNSEITIQSRFAREKNDFFLHYMLQKVFSINLFDLKHSLEKESIFDFLLYIFPYYLKRALRQGLYKEYHRQEYNNANVVVQLISTDILNEMCHLLVMWPILFVNIALIIKSHN